MRIFLVINKFAGRKNNYKKVLKKIQYRLKSNHYIVEYAFSEYRGHATKLAADAAKKNFDRIVAVGGDGTVNEVALGLLETSKVMGIIPTGSGNGLARDLGISTGIEKSIDSLLKGNVKQIDVCRFNKQHFLCTSGIGFDASVADKMGKTKKRGFLQYIKLTIQESISFQPFNIKIQIDDKIIEKPVFLLTFANARQFGNNAFIAPLANMGDGLIDVVLVNPFNKILLPVFAIALFTKIIHKLPFVETYKAKKVELENTETNIFHFDGEPGKLIVPAKISIDTNKLNVICG